ncbi:CASP-like protein 2C1 [Mangifera indica]|uniref:CASP-like protein 2C1 n=1 Tax=Mangifera indica TaxID=29780 RepID=UPI001CFA180D|nr:CASP-like protein 2C1 [Mangifera indica]
MDILKTEAFLRLSAALVFVLAACLVRLDTQTKFIFFTERKITFKDLNGLQALVYAAFVAAGYNVLQLSRCIFFVSCFHGNLSKRSYRYLAWVGYLLDQVVLYLTFATNSAAVEQSMLVVTGMKEFQWAKWCNKYTRFCFQTGGAICCCFLACCLMAFTTFVSGFNLFRLYSPKKFLRLKNT